MCFAYTPFFANCSGSPRGCLLKTHRIPRCDKDGRPAIITNCAKPIYIGTFFIHGSHCGEHGNPKEGWEPDPPAHLLEFEKHGHIWPHLFDEEHKPSVVEVRSTCGESQNTEQRVKDKFLLFDATALYPKQTETASFVSTSDHRAAISQRGENLTTQPGEASIAASLPTRTRTGLNADVAEPDFTQAFVDFSSNSSIPGISMSFPSPEPLPSEEAWALAGMPLDSTLPILHSDTAQDLVWPAHAAPQDLDVPDISLDIAPEANMLPVPSDSHISSLPAAGQSDRGQRRSREPSSSSSPTTDSGQEQESGEGEGKAKAKQPAKKKKPS